MRATRKTRATCAAWLGAVLSMLGCNRQPSPCTTPGVCAVGEECLANRCVPLGADPVPPRSVRVLLDATEIALVQPGASGVIVLGAATGRSTAYLRFPRAAAPAEQLATAFLLLTPAEGTAGSGERITVEAWRIGERWRAETLARAHGPLLGPPSSDGVAFSGQLTVLRLDVTALVRRQLEHPEHDHGIALTASSGSGHGASFAVGGAAGPGPRLELYLER